MKAKDLIAKLSVSPESDVFFTRNVKEGGKRVPIFSKISVVLFNGEEIIVGSETTRHHLPSKVKQLGLSEEQYQQMVEAGTIQ